MRERALMTSRPAQIVFGFLAGAQIALAIPGQSGPENSKLPRGEIIAKVACSTETSETYALYLPSNYSLERKWPIIFAFDPGARGQVAVETFREAAEKYGYIVVGSNNSRNGPWTVSLEAIHALWIDAHSRFPLDERRIYTAGFSGGARVAVAMAQGVSGKIAGVIACGAGFPLGEGQGPAKDTPFIFFATIGIRDFNFSELRALDQKLADLGLTHRVVVFDGPHQWAPKDLALEALEWLDLNAMKTGRLARDPALIDGIYARQSEEGRRLNTSGDIAGAFHREEALAADFKGLRATPDIDAEVAKMRDAKDVKQALKREVKREANIASLEAEYYSTYKQILANLFAPGNGEYERRQAVRELRLQELRDLETKKKDTDQGIAAQRNLFGVMVHSLEDATQEMSLGDYQRARVELEIAAACAPENGYILFQLARAYAMNKDAPNALAALRQSVGHGFTDLDQLEKNPDLASLRGQPGYQEVVESVKKKLEAPANPPR